MQVVIDGVEYVPLKRIEASSKFLEALECRWDFDCGENITIRDYLHAQLELLWKEKEAFSGKYPFGNSGWYYDLDEPLVSRGFIKGNSWTYDDGHTDYDVYDREEADQFILTMIKTVFYGAQNG